MNLKLLSEIDSFLTLQDSMRLRESCSGESVVEGILKFTAIYNNQEKTGSYELRIVIPSSYPEELIEVFETEGKIPRTGLYHLNTDGSLCLGAPFRLMLFAKQNPSFQSFISTFLIPHLFGVTQILGGAKTWPFEDLSHGEKGIFQDYKDFFDAENNNQALLYIKALSLKKRIANKMICPCGCKLRLGRCSTRQKIFEIQ